MADKVGQVIIKTDKEHKFEIYYLKDAVKGYEEQFGALHPSYWVVCIVDESFRDSTINLGELMFEIEYLKSQGGKVISFNFPEEIQRIGEKEMCLIGLR